MQGLEATFWGLQCNYNIQVLLNLYAGAQQGLPSQDRQHIGQLFNLPKPSSTLEGLAAIVAQQDQVLTQLIAGDSAAHIFGCLKCSSMS